MRHSMSKDTAFNGETTRRHTFLCSDSQCLPPGDPRILCAKPGYPITGKSFISFLLSIRELVRHVIGSYFCGGQKEPAAFSWSAALYYLYWRFLAWFFLDFSQITSSPLFSLGMDSKASETRARVKIIPREESETRWDREKWGTTDKAQAFEPVCVALTTQNSDWLFNGNLSKSVKNAPAAIDPRHNHNLQNLQITRAEQIIRVALVKATN